MNNWRRFRFAFISAAFAVGVGIAKAFTLHAHGYPITSWALWALLIVALVSFVVSFIWTGVEAKHGAATANRWVALPLGIMVAIAVLAGGWVVAWKLTSGIEEAADNLNDPSPVPVSRIEPPAPPSHQALHSSTAGAVVP